MKKTFDYLAITSCFVLGTTFAYADADSSQGNMAEKMFKAMDTNSDGMVTREEFSTFGDKKFKEMDVNGNGQITLEEMKAAHRKMMSGGGQMDDQDYKRMGDTRDRNGDSSSDKMRNNAWPKEMDQNR